MVDTKSRKKGDLRFIQEMNRSIILDIIRKQGPISRTDIAKECGLSPSTVSSGVNELISEGLAYEVGTGLSSGGRKPKLVEFYPDSKYIIGVSLTNSTITIAELNLEARVKKKKEYVVNQRKGDGYIAFVISSIQDFLNPYEDDVKKCAGVSIISPGIIDAEHGVINYNAKLNLEKIPLKKLVEEAVGLKTVLDNDVNALVLAERNFGRYKEFDELMYVTIDQGIGVGIYQNGSIFRGQNGGAGEFGHISIDHRGKPCDCGNMGCLEEYIGWPAIYSQIIGAITKGKETQVLEMADGEIQNITPRMLRQALEVGDALAISIFEQIATYLAAGLVTLIHLFNPEGIIIGGELAQNNVLLHKKVNQLVSKQAFTYLIKDLKIRSASLGSDFGVIGAAAILLRDLFHFSM